MCVYLLNIQIPGPHCKQWIQRGLGQESAFLISLSCYLKGPDTCCPCRKTGGLWTTIPEVKRAFRRLWEMSISPSTVPKWLVRKWNLQRGLWDSISGSEEESLSSWSVIFYFKFLSFVFMQKDCSVEFWGIFKNTALSQTLLNPKARNQRGWIFACLREYLDTLEVGVRIFCSFWCNENLWS